MWIMLSNSFLSIVDKDCGPDELLVRARRSGDIQRVFGNVKVSRNTRADYLFRARVPRTNAVSAITREIESINYPNFKDSVKDEDLHHAYLSVWQAVSHIQNPPPYSG